MEPKPVTRSHKPSYLLDILLVSILSLYGIVWLNLARRISARLIDFITYYSTGVIIMQGHGQKLYDLAVQAHVQQSLLKGHSFEGGVLAYVHPPFQALLFAPFSLLPFIPAYIVWVCLMVTLAVLSVVSLLSVPPLHPLRSSFTEILLAAFCFFPVFISLVQGQDSLMLLFFLTGGFILLKRGKELESGMVLALGLFKFHLLIPLYVMLLSLRRWKVVAGSICTCVGLIALSFASVGVEGITDYARLLPRMSNWTNEYNFTPSEMRNLRGMLAIALGNRHQMINLLSLCFGGVFLALVIWGASRSSSVTHHNFDFQFSASLIAGLLIGHYLYVHDQSILVIPLIFLWALARVAERTTRRWCIGLIVMANPVTMLPIVNLGKLRLPINVFYLLVLFFFFWRLSTAKLDFSPEETSLKRGQVSNTCL